MVAAAEFWTFADKGELRLPRCEECRHWCWYPGSRCPECFSEAITWEATGARGTLFSWTRVQRPFTKQLEPFQPILVALVQLDAGPRVLGWMDIDTETPEIGLPVRGEFREFDGIEHRRLVFQPR